MRKLWMENTKSCARGHTESRLSGLGLQHPGSARPDLGLQTAGSAIGRQRHLTALQHLPASATLSLPSGSSMTWEQKVASWNKVGKESHEEAASSPQNSHPQHHPRGLYRGDHPPYTCPHGSWHCPEHPEGITRDASRRGCGATWDPAPALPAGTVGTPTGHRSPPHPDPPPAGNTQVRS